MGMEGDWSNNNLLNKIVDEVRENVSFKLLEIMKKHLKQLAKTHCLDLCLEDIRKKKIMQISLKETK
ncbi:hypothetical protein Lal_00044645 [Lupinus albus]|nr:hypothetical protein Lal_00044645 [Lupinus albus]